MVTFYVHLNGRKGHHLLQDMRATRLWKRSWRVVEQCTLINSGWRTLQKIEATSEDLSKLRRVSVRENEEIVRRYVENVSVRQRFRKLTQQRRKLKAFKIVINHINSNYVLHGY